MKTSEITNELFTALSIAQSHIDAVSKDSTNPFFKSKYASLSSVWAACRHHLTDVGLSIVQGIGHSEGGHVLITRLSHKSGQWIEDDGIPLITSKNDMQGLGSAITYARRYALASLVGLSQEDDDGESIKYTKPKEQTPSYTEKIQPIAPSVSKAVEHPGKYVCQVKSSKFNLRTVDSLSVEEADNFIDYGQKNADLLPIEMKPFYRNVIAYWREGKK